MNDTPTFPVFMINNRGGVLGAKEMNPLTHSSLAGICQIDNVAARYFDAHGKVWSATIARAPYPVNIWTKILAQIYNPRFQVELQWKQEGSFTLTELQERLCKCVDTNEDILTQFMEADKLKTLIRETKTFEHLFNRMKGMNII